MSKPHIEIEKHLLASTCLLLASKFHEIDENLIMSTDLQKELADKMLLSVLDMYNTEIIILKALDWNLYRPLPLDYL